jgi:Tol biopolymer transport system component
MPLASGAQLGPYQILAPLGAGGMGEVYRASDAKLHREVALKVLPAAFAQDPERMARFGREAQVLAALNHPNIATIYGLEESEGIRALVMELVEGPTLAYRIGGAPIPIEEALQVARQIAEALEAAHEKGIVHRDLKPANVKITPEGNVKVLDFGLAKALAGDSAKSDPASSPTLTMKATQAGFILGTAAYMAPEQARGVAVDKRADIWAFGVVLWEMLTGRQLFAGDNVTDILAAVVRADPDWNALPAATPAPVRRLLRRCLEKDRKKRLPDIGVARLEIDESLTAPAEAVPSAQPQRRSWLPWAVAGALAVVLLVFTFAWFHRAAPEAQVAKLSLTTPEKMSLSSMAVSPDGRRLAITGADASGKTQLWVRPLDSLTVQPMAGTEGALYPFWSPDSRFIGFFADNKLKKMEATGGPPLTLCDAPQGRGGAWNRDGVIIFGGLQAPISRVSAAGGEARPLLSIDQSRQERDHRWPRFLPDGRHFLYTIRSTSNYAGIYVGTLDSQERRRLLADVSSSDYVPSGKGGYMLFWRGGTLMGQPFDTGKQQLSGEPFPVAEAVGYSPALTLAAFAVSENGVLVHHSGQTGQNQLTWFDRGGKRLGTVAEVGVSLRPSLSPDEKQVVVDRVEGATSNYDIWLTELARGVSSRFTFDPTSDFQPVWSPDGSRIVFTSNRAGTFNLYQKIASGAGTDELLLKSANSKFPNDWSLDGQFLLYDDVDPKTKGDLWVLPMSGDRKPIPFLRTEFNERSAVFSPDGKWISYDSDESGKAEVYVQSFPASGAKWQISKVGGTLPRWRRDGKELFYLAADRKLMAVEVKLGPAFQAGIPRPLFDSRMDTANVRYTVTRDGQRFLIPTPIVEASSTPPTVVINWPAGLRR